MSERVSQTVTVWIEGKPVHCMQGLPLINAIMQAGLLVQSACGGNGVCRLCRIWVDNPVPAPPPNVVEMQALSHSGLGQGMRLSCQVLAVHGMHVRRVPLDLPQTQPQAGGKKHRRKGRPP